METKAEVYIPLTQGKVAVIDFDDFEKVRGIKWYAYKKGRRFYAVRNAPMVNGKRAMIFMHRAITGCPPDLEVNHIYGDGLDNRRENLQVCTRQQNNFAFRRKKINASSKYRGVDWRKQISTWRARIRRNGKQIHIGLFDTEEAAARAYDVKAVELFGEHASPNFPDQNQCQSLILAGGAV